MGNLFQRIDTVFVPTRDVARATAWYVGVLNGVPGWKSDNGEYQALSFGETALTLFLTDDPVYYLPRRSAFNFYVPNAEEAHAYLKGKGVTVEVIDQYGAKYFSFQDPDGNVLEVCEY